MIQVVTETKKVEAGGIEPPSAAVSPQLLRAYPVFSVSPRELPADRPPAAPASMSGPALAGGAAVISRSPACPDAQHAGYPAVVASTRLADISGETSRHLSREGQV